MATQKHSIKTPSLSASAVSRNWYIVDASENSLGRVATIIAERIIGKHKPTFSPNIDNGDHVIVINSDKLKVTGRKMNQKMYYRHSGYMGGLTETTLEKKMEADSTAVIIAAVKGMLPKNKLQSGRIARLKVYAGAEHGHEAQKPQELGVK
jgi:large subunit ribosomal protein L13